MPEGKKWRGKSVYQVLTRLNDASRTAGALRLVKIASEERIERLTREAKEKLIELADELTGLEPDDLYLCHSWDCKESPTDRCIYNVTEDPMKDDCLFCGDPLDRG